MKKLFWILFFVAVTLKAYAEEAMPSKDYMKMMHRWNTATHFAEDSSEIASTKLIGRLKKDPKTAPHVTQALELDLKQFFYEIFSAEDTLVKLAQVYQNYFSLSEMQELIEFYESPLGKKIAKTRAEVMLKTQAVGDAVLVEHRKEYMELIKKYFK